MTSQLAVASFSAEELRQNTVSVFRDGGGTRPDVRVVEAMQRQYVLKDYSFCSPWFGSVMGSLLTGREEQALRALAGIDGIPKLMGKLGRTALLMEYVQNSDRARKRLPLMDQNFFDRLSQLVSEMHERGVAHCDLRRSSNILTDEGGKPYLVDFVSCVFQGSRWNPLARFVFWAFCRADRNAIIKLKQRVAPELMTDAERNSASHNFFDRIVRGMSKALRVVIRICLTGQRRN